MIYLYGAVCASMIVFNIVYAVLIRGSEPRLEKRQQRFLRLVSAQTDRLSRGEPVERRHLDLLQRELRRVRNLAAFEPVLRALTAEDAPGGRAYLEVIQPTVLHLSLGYLHRDSEQTAYFSYFLSHYMLHRHLPVQAVQEVLLEYMGKENLYCRVNALQALCSFGSPEHVVEGLRIQDRGSVFVHDKILTETLLGYTGNHETLIDPLWKELHSFSERTQLAVLNYIRFSSGAYRREMLSLLRDASAGKELRLSAVRYFGRYPYDPALEPLLAFASESDPLRWEYATVSVSSLARYPGERVVAALKEALHSPNWYIRYAAASSLEAHNVGYEDVADIVTGSDRYAREMLLYRLETHTLHRKGG